MLAISLPVMPAACAGAPAGATAPSAQTHPSQHVDAASEGPRALATDPLWQAARSGDPVDVGRLADREGAIGLLEVLAAGQPWTGVALAALPLAQDAELAVVPLCARLEREPPALRLEVLRTLHTILAEPPRAVEHAAADELASCDGLLEALLGRRGLSAAEHDLAASARRMLAEHVAPQ